MRRLGAFTLSALALATLTWTAGGTAAEVRPRPNIIVIQTDDQALIEMISTVTGRQGTAPVMPRVIGLLAGNGMVFHRYYSTYPLSCPSRTTLLTGQYAHNHRVLANKFESGGRPTYCSAPGFVDHTTAMPASLQAAGYRTIHAGRFLNGYPPAGALSSVPPGWNEWHTPINVDDDHPAAAYFGYQMNDNGDVSAPIGDSTYAAQDPAAYFTDVITQRAIESIDAGDQSKPFYLELDHRAPHEDARLPAGPQPSPIHVGTMRGVALRHGGAFNEANVSDKPRYVQVRHLLTGRQRQVIRYRNRRRLESLRSVDDSIAKLLSALTTRGMINNTYVFFFSDNGFFRGEHRFPKGKVRHYEPATHVPLVVRGPGIPAGTTSDALVANIDIAPTILELAGAQAARRMDGRSMTRFMVNPSLLTNRPILLEQYTRKQGRRQLAGAAKVKPALGDYQGIIAGRYKLVRNYSGENELYDLKADPEELRSLHRVPRFRGVLRYLGRQLRVLARCDGAACAAEIPTPRGPGR